MSIRVGFGEVDITPDRPAPLVGFYREDDISRGVMKPLLAQVSVWEETERCVSGSRSGSHPLWSCRGEGSECC